MELDGFLDGETLKGTDGYGWMDGWIFNSLDKIDIRRSNPHSYIDTVTVWLLYSYYTG